ncbi:MAG: glycosyltransferase family 2 protein [Chitinophagales bacterium]
MPPISVVIITYNEEKNIGRCIRSVQSIADDIVVLDSFSEDSTEAICKELGARFVQHKFDGHIEQKNRAIGCAMYPIVLSLDADEAIDEELKKAIMAVKNNWEYDAYFVNRLTNYCGKWIWHGHWYPDRKLRLWDSRKGKWGGLNPHDKFEMQEGVSVDYLNGHLLHYSFYTFEDFKKQMCKFASISARAAYKQGKRAGSWNLLLNPVAKFFTGYFLKRGFLDGSAGFTIARYNAYATYLKYKELLELYRNEK